MKASQHLSVSPSVHTLQHSYSMRLERLYPYLIIAGQLLVFFQIEQRAVQAVMLAFLAFQIWKKFKTNLADN